MNGKKGQILLVPTFNRVASSPWFLLGVLRWLPKIRFFRCREYSTFAVESED